MTKVAALPNEMLCALTESHAQFLRNIQSLRVSMHASDVSCACKNGAVLLGISKIDNDPEGEGFRYLVGLERGVEMTQYLKNYFQ